MSLLQSLLHITDFRSPLPRAIVPCVVTALAVQGAVGLPSVLASSDRFFDISGTLTFIAASALSLSLPALRAHSASNLTPPSLLELLNGNAMNWRQIALTGMVTLWTTRLGTFLYLRILDLGHDSRFDRIRKDPTRFAFSWFLQAIWVSVQLMPVVALNAVPASVLNAALPGISVTDVLGGALWAVGFTYETVADAQKRQWQKKKKNKLHDEAFMARGLFSESRFPHYFGEITLWTGIATTAAGALACKAVQQSLGFSGGFLGVLSTTALSFMSPAFVTWLLLRVTGVSLTDRRYGKRYGDRKDYQDWKKNTPLLFPKLW